MTLEDLIERALKIADSSKSEVTQLKAIDLLSQFKGLKVSKQEITHKTQQANSDNHDDIQRLIDDMREHTAKDAKTAKKLDVKITLINVYSVSSFRLTPSQV